MHHDNHESIEKLRELITGYRFLHVDNAMKVIYGAADVGRKSLNSMATFGSLRATIRTNVGHREGSEGECSVVATCRKTICFGFGTSRNGKDRAKIENFGARPKGVVP